MSPRARQIVLTAATAAACAAIVLAVPVTAVRAVFAVPLCLLLPGYAITQASFRRVDLGTGRTLMLSIGLSLATLAIGSLVLNLLPGGLRLASWTILLVLVVVASSAVALRRSSRQRSQPRRTRRPAPRLSELLLLLLAVLLAGSAFTLSRIPLGAANAVGYTQLWMFQSGGARTPAVRIGVQSAERAPTTYTLVLRAGSSTPLIVATNFVLRPGAQTGFVAPLRLPPSTAPALITAELFRSDSPTVYRHVTALIVPPRPRSAVHRRKRALGLRPASALGHRP
jgi:hypothetical protein